jgi:hypothetical protein
MCIVLTTPNVDEISGNCMCILHVRIVLSLPTAVVHSICESFFLHGVLAQDFLTHNSGTCSTI